MLLLAALALAPRAFQNPLAHGADPCLQWFRGWYYLTVTTGRDVQMRRARRLGELRDAKPVVVYRSDDPAQSQGVWAPEFHRFGGRWYLYVTATAGTEPGHRMFVAEGTGDSPMGPYRFKAKLLTDPKDEFYAIDGHPFRTPDGRMWFAWCGRPSAAGQGIYLSRMSDPWTLTGERRVLDVSGYGCPYVREGPEAIVRDGWVYLTYSACGADTPDYRVGMVRARVGADLLDLASWTQAPAPLLQRDDAAGVYGPGHHFFFRSPDGKDDWIAYHAKPSTTVTFADRDTRAQRLFWRDGWPYVGAPVATGKSVAAPSGES